MQVPNIKIYQTRRFRCATGKCLVSSSVYPVHQRNVWAGWEQTICMYMPICRWLNGHTIPGSCTQASQTCHCCLPWGDSIGGDLIFIIFLLIAIKNCYGIGNNVWKFQVSTMKIVPVSHIWSSCFICILMTQRIRNGDNIWQ